MLEIMTYRPMHWVSLEAKMKPLNTVQWSFNKYIDILISLQIVLEKY